MKGVVVVCLIALMGCATAGPPKNLMLPSDNQLKLREQQSRSYKTTDEANLLSASAALLQDMGFNIDESNKELGILTASKMRSAVSAKQQTAAILLTVLTVASGRPIVQPTDKEQKMRAGVVVKPLGDGHSTIVRVTFQRIVYNTEGQVSTREMLGSDEIYTEFFDKLSKAVFLEANDL